MGFIDFTDGNILDEIGLDTMMRQGIMVFASVSARDASLVSGVKTDGMFAYTTSNKVLWQYDGTNWVPMESAWKTFATVWSGPTALSIGNGTLTCKWRMSGGLVFAHYELVRGSTTNAGSSTYSFTVPLQADTTKSILGTGLARDASPFTEYVFTCIPIADTAFALMSNSANARYSNTVPFAVATDDSYMFTVSYKPVDGVTIT